MQKNLWKILAFLVVIAIAITTYFLAPTIFKSTSTGTGSTITSNSNTSPTESIKDTFKEPTETLEINYNNNPQIPVPANMVMVLIKDGTAQSDVEKLATELGGTIVGSFDYISLYQIETKATTQIELDALIAKAKTNPIVENSGPMLPLVGKDIKGNVCKLLEDTYTDPKAAAPYEMIGMERAWELINASGVNLNKVTVGVVDTGLNEDSSDGKGGRIKTLDDSDKLNTPDEINTHGTSTSNIIGASWDNSGMRGVAGGLGDKLQVNVSSLTKAKRKYNPIKIADPKDPTHIVTSAGKAYQVNTFQEIKKQIDAGAEVINYSWGSATPGPQNAFDNAVTKKFLAKMQAEHPKVVFVAAAGNEGMIEQKDPKTGNVTMVEGPALDGTNYDMGGTKADNLITVGSVKKDGKLSFFTNTATAGGEVTLAASGDQVALGVNADGTTYYASGTSFSTPQVSAAAAILKSINPDLTAKEIKDILVKTADTKITNPKLLPPGVKEQEIAQRVGGRVMRLDNAVADQLKKVMGDKFDIKALENISKISANAKSDSKDPLHFTITANLPATHPSGTDVNAKFSGEGSLGGLSTQHMSGAGSINWDWQFISEKNTATVTITRLDSKACTRLSLKPNSIAGTYKGNINIAIPQYSQYISQTSFDFPTTIIIDNEGNATLTFTASGSVNTGGNGVYITVKYTGKGNMTGAISEDVNIALSGGYSSTYNTILPAQYAAAIPASQRGLLNGVTTGTGSIKGKITDKTISGSSTFINNQGGSSSTGTFKVTKVEGE